MSAASKLIDGEELDAALEGLKSLSYDASMRFHTCLRNTSTAAAPDKLISRDKAIGELATKIACFTNATCSHTGEWEDSRADREELCKKIFDKLREVVVVPVNWPVELFRLERKHKPADIHTIFLGMDPCPLKYCYADANEQTGYAFDEYPATSPSIKFLFQYGLSPSAYVNFKNFGIVQVNLNRIIADEHQSGRNHFLATAFQAYFEAFVKNIITARAQANNSTKLHIVVCTTGAYFSRDDNSQKLPPWPWLVKLHKDYKDALVMTCTLHPSRQAFVSNYEGPILPDSNAADDTKARLKKVDTLKKKCEDIFKRTDAAALVLAEEARDLYNKEGLEGTLPFVPRKVALGIPYRLNCMTGERLFDVISSLGEFWADATSALETERAQLAKGMARLQAAEAELQAELQAAKAQLAAT